MATKQTYFASLASILLLASCSQDEILKNEPNAPRKAISYNVTADRVTRAQDFFTNSNLPKSFVLSAWYHTGTAADGKIYFDSDLIQSDGSSSYSRSAGQRYWPTGAGEQLDFYAYTGDDNASFSLLDDSDNLSPTISNVQVDADAANHKDLIYVAQHGETPKGTGTVTLAFQHAMSQIAVKAKNTNSCIYVEISDVAIGGMASEGTLKLPVSSTDKAQWEASSNVSEMSSNMSAIVDLEATAKTLTTDVFMMIPGNYSKATFADSKFTGSYIKLNCKIYNVANTDKGYQTTDVKIHDGELYIPYAFNLDMGKKYNYTINFGTGNAGLDENGDPTLVALNVAVSVADWGEAADEDIEAE